MKIFAIVVVAAFLALLAGCEEAARPPVRGISQTPAAKSAAPTYRLDPQFNSIAIELINEDIDSFLEGNETHIGEGIVVAIASNVAKLYTRDQAAGDQRYLSKKVFLAGTMSAINDDAGRSPHVVFEGTGSLILQAHLSPEGAAEMPDLRKVRHTAFVCTGAGVVDRTLMFKDCVSVPKYARVEAAKFTRDLEAFANGEEVPRFVSFFAVHVESKARTIDDAVPCAPACVKLVNEELAQDPRTIAALVQEMREGGLKIPPLRRRPLGA